MYYVFADFAIVLRLSSRCDWGWAMGWRWGTVVFLILFPVVWGRDLFAQPNLCSQFGLSTDQFFCCRNISFSVVENVGFNLDLLDGRDSGSLISPDELVDWNRSQLLHLRSAYRPRTIHAIRIGSARSSEHVPLPSIRFEGKMISKTIRASLEMRLVPLPAVNTSEHRDVAKLVPRSCRHYFNGTVHVFSKLHTHNLFHFVNDNLLPLASQLVIDEELYPEYVSLPRVRLVGLHDQEESLADVPHVQLLRRWLPEQWPWSTLDAVCVRRVIWGTGPRLVYLHALREMRFRSAEKVHGLAREVFCELCALAALQSGSKEWQCDSWAVDKLCGSPGKDDLETAEGKSAPSRLRAVLYSRGDSGEGRSLSHEDRVLDALQRKGFEVTLSKQAHPLARQLQNALTADLMLGLHGAGLSHAIFAPRGVSVVELKSHYGFSLDLFAVIANSRRGNYAQLDIRSYFSASKRKHDPVDSALVGRVLAASDAVTGFRRGFGSNHTGSANRTVVHGADQSINGRFVRKIGTSAYLDLVLAFQDESASQFTNKEPFTASLWGDYGSHYCASPAFIEYWNLIGAQKELLCVDCSSNRVH